MAISDRVIITFNNIAKKVNIKPEKKADLSSAEREEMITYIRSQLNVWMAGGSKKTTAQLEPLDKKAAAHMTHEAHAIFRKLGNKVKLDALAALYIGRSDDEKEVLKPLPLTLGTVREAFKRLAVHSNGVFLMGTAATDIVRMLDEKNKSTGAEKPAAKAAKGQGKKFNDETLIKKFMGSVKKLGFTTKEQFTAAKVSYGKTDKEYITVGQAKAWLAKQTHN